MPTPNRNIRVDDEQWERWQAAAEERGYALSDFIRACVEEVLTEGGLQPKPFVTRSGKILSNEDIQKLADEAERGYDPKDFKQRTNADAEDRSVRGRTITAGDLAPKDVTPRFKPDKKK